MKKITYIFKYVIYYIVGCISFSTIAFITQRITISILLKSQINPIQDIYNILNYIYAYSLYYLIVYTLLYGIILYSVRRYDKYVVNKLNEKLKRVKDTNDKSDFGGDSNGEG